MDDHLAVLVEFVGINGERFDRLLNKHLCTGYCRAVFDDVVVVIAVLNQASILGQLAFDVVVILAVGVLCNLSRLDHLTVLVETVDASRLEVVVLDHVVLAVHHRITRVVNVIVGVTQFDQASVFGQDTVLVVSQVSVFIHQRCGQDDLTILADAVDTCRQLLTGTQADLLTGQHEAVNLDPVIIALVFDQFRPVCHTTIRIVVQLTICFLDQISSQDSLAVRAESVGASSQLIILSVGNLLLGVHKRAAVLANVVVVTVDLDQALVDSQSAVLIVEQRAVFINQFCLHVQGAIRVNAVNTRRHQVIGLLHIILRVGDNLAALSSEVVLTVRLDQARSRLDTADVVVSLVDALADNHPAVLVELVSIDREGRDGLLDQHRLIGDCSAVCIDVVVSIIVLDHAGTLLKRTVHVVVKLTIIPLNQFSSQDGLAVLIEAIGTSRQQVIGLVFGNINLNTDRGNCSILVVVGTVERVQADVVDIASILNQTSIRNALTAVVVVIQRTILINNCLSNNQMAILIEPVGTGASRKTIVVGNPG